MADLFQNSVSLENALQILREKAVTNRPYVLFGSYLLRSNIDPNSILHERDYKTISEYFSWFDDGINDNLHGAWIVVKLSGEEPRRMPIGYSYFRHTSSGGDELIFYCDTDGGYVRYPQADDDAPLGEWWTYGEAGEDLKLLSGQLTIEFMWPYEVSKEYYDAFMECVYQGSSSGDSPYKIGFNTGKNIGYNEGHQDGHDEGYDEGLRDSIPAASRVTFTVQVGEQHSYYAPPNTYWYNWVKTAYNVGGKFRTVSGPNYVQYNHNGQWVILRNARGGGTVFQNSMIVGGTYYIS